MLPQRTEILKQLAIPAVVSLAIFIFYFVLLGVGSNLAGGWDFQHFVFQAQGFAHGQLHYAVLPPTLSDSTCVGDRCYWPLAPLPGVLLTPLVWLFGLHPFQAYLTPLLTVATLLLAWRVARLERFSSLDAGWLAAGFTFASIYFGSVGFAFSWQFASAIGVVLQFSALYEYLTRRRLWLVGILLGLLLATRATAALLVVPLALDLLLERTVLWRKRCRSLVALLAPILIAFSLLCWYNQARFGSPLDSGYMTARVNPRLVELRAQYGLFQLRNVPSNLYYYFIGSVRPLVDYTTYHLKPPYVRLGYGAGFFWLSPLFLLMFGAQLTTRRRRLLAGGAALTTLVLLTYYSINYDEFGPRYLLDALPSYYLLVLWAFPERKLGGRHRWVIVLSAALNLYLLGSLSIR